MFFRILLLSIFSYTCAWGQVSFTEIDSFGLECKTGFYLGQDFDGYNSSLGTSVTEGIQPDMLCGTEVPSNIRWFTFYVSDTTFNIEIQFSGCKDGSQSTQGLQAGVLSSCDIENDLIVCESLEGTYGTLTLEGITKPGLHYLYLNGKGQSVCDFEIVTRKGVCPDLMRNDETGPGSCKPSVQGFSGDTIRLCQSVVYRITPNLSFLPNFTRCGRDADVKKVINNQPFFKVKWDLSQPTGYTFLKGEIVSIVYDTGGDNKLKTQSTIRFDVPGTYELSHQFYRNPNLPDEVVFDKVCDEFLVVIVEPSRTIVNEPDTICFGEEYSFCGRSYKTSQTLMCQEDASCDLIMQDLVVLSPQTVDLGTQYICEGGSFSFGGIEYDTPDDYSYKGPDLCDTTFLFTVDTYEVDITLSGGDPITCSQPMSSVSARVETDLEDELSLYWSDAEGNKLSDELTYNTSEPGRYYFTVENKDNPSCSYTDGIEVTKNEDLPDATIQDYWLDCNETKVEPSVVSSEGITSYSWSGPNGFSSDVVAPELTDAGNYEVTVLFDNGCELPLSFEVKGDFTEPSATLLVDSLDCSGYGYATYLSTSLADVEWTDGTNILGQDSLFRFEEMGTYSLKLTGSNGCESTYDFEPVDLRHVPTAGLTDEKWLCTTTDISFNLSSQADQSWTVTILEGDISHDAGIVNAQGPGVFTVEVIDNNTSCSGMDTVSILDVREDLGVQLTAYDPSCPGEKDGSVVVDMQKGTAPYSYYLNGQEQELSNLSSGDYTLKVVDANGCEQDTSFRLREALPFEILTDPEIAIRYGQSKMITLEHNLPDSLYQSTLWYVNNNRIASGEEYELSDTLGGILRGVVYDVNGCEQFLDFLISYDNNIDIYIPNIFSPNDDGNNDKWTIKSHFDGLTLDHVEIYDRWGSKVFQHHNVNILDDNIQWDGTLNGAAMPTGSYVYLIQYTQPDGIQKMRKGTINLVR